MQALILVPESGGPTLFARIGILRCQSACKFDPSSASNFDPFVRRALLVALVSSELAGIAEAGRARVAWSRAPDRMQLLAMAMAR